MNDETRKKLQNLIAWLYDNNYIDNNEIGMIINYTDEGSKFIKDQLGDKWDINWCNFCCDDSIWLPYPNVYNIGEELQAYDCWDYVYFSQWENTPKEYEQRLNLYIELIDADLTETDYIELDDIVL